MANALLDVRSGRPDRLRVDTEIEADVYKVVPRGQVDSQRRRFSKLRWARPSAAKPRSSS
jgi:hypothetical protein